MKFNSQICTTKIQSERLLALGLKVETADMVGSELSEVPICHPYKRIKGLASDFWSLHRLIEMLNYQVIHNGKKYEPVIALDGMAYQDVCGDDAVVGWSGDLYTDVIDCIEWLIKEGYFNKKYLEE